MCLNQGNSTNGWLNVMTVLEHKVLGVGPELLILFWLLLCPKTLLLGSTVIYFFISICWPHFLLSIHFLICKMGLSMLPPPRATMGIK